VCSWIGIISSGEIAVVRCNNRVLFAFFNVLKLKNVLKLIIDMIENIPITCLSH